DLEGRVGETVPKVVAWDVPLLVEPAVADVILHGVGLCVATGKGGELIQGLGPGNGQTTGEVLLTKQELAKGLAAALPRVPGHDDGGRLVEPGLLGGVIHRAARFND